MPETFTTASFSRLGIRAPAWLLQRRFADHGAYHDQIASTPVSLEPVGPPGQRSTGDREIALDLPVGP